MNALESLGTRILASLLIAAAVSASAADDLEVIRLPAANTSGGKPLMDALRERQTIRDIRADKLSNLQLGNLLWAAFGVNRPSTGHRTAPSAMNSQELDLYVALEHGLYLYEPKTHQLQRVSREDVRGKTSGQPFGTNAPVTLIFVADLPRLEKAKPDIRLVYANFDAGCISQNVYLFCASEGLATVVHDLDRKVLKPAMQLRPEQEIIMAQAVGLPK